MKKNERNEIIKSVSAAPSAPGQQHMERDRSTIPGIFQLRKALTGYFSASEGRIVKQDQEKPKF